MKTIEHKVPLPHHTVRCKQNEDHLLAKRFFPFYMRKVKHLIHGIYLLHPKISYNVIIKLLSVAIRKKISTNATAFYKKGIRKAFRIDGATFYTYSYGEGPLILMLHGWCSNGARWRIYVNELVRSGYKVMVVDAPGHGTAPGRFSSVFLYAKGIKIILASEQNWHTVITHSIAGLTAIAAIGNSKKQHHPSKFIMMNTFSDANAILEKFSCCLGISKKVVKGVKEQLSKYNNFPLQEFSIQKHYSRINAQGLLIYDTSDRVVPRSEAEHIISTIKPLKVIKTQGLGHNLKSGCVVKHVLNFVKLETNHRVGLKNMVLCSIN